MNKLELARALAEKKNIHFKQAKEILDLIFRQFAKALAKGKRVDIRGFGSFMVRTYGSYTVGHPRYGNPIEIAPTKWPLFKVGRDLKRRVNAK